MTDSDIREYIEGCEQPIFMKDVLSELREDDPTVSFKRVARILREMGFENHCRKNVQNVAGRGSSWTRENAVRTCGDETKQPETEPEKTEPKSTEQIIDEVEERNEQNSSLNARLLESLKVSRDLKEEIMHRQREALVSMARQVLSLFGDSYEQQRYKP